MIVGPDDDDFYDDDDDDMEGGVGCANCERGWVHGCCDDLCRGRDAIDCHSAIACRTCNPDGDVA